jgi:hypothetical protein
VSAETLYLVFAVACAAGANGVWRLLGLVLASRVDEDSLVFVWVRMVATALVAALVSQLVLFPTGALTAAPTWLRVGSVVLGVAAYFLGRRSVALGIGVGIGALIVGLLGRGM